MFDTLSKERDHALEEQNKAKKDKQMTQVSLTTIKEQWQASKLEKESQ